MMMVTCRFGMWASTWPHKNMGACWAGKQLENRTKRKLMVVSGGVEAFDNPDEILWKSQAKVDQRMERDNFENVNMLPFKDKRVWRYAGDPYQHILLEIWGRRKTKPPAVTFKQERDGEVWSKKKNVLLWILNIGQWESSDRENNRKWRSRTRGT